MSGRIASSSQGKRPRQRGQGEDAQENDRTEALALYHYLDGLNIWSKNLDIGVLRLGGWELLRTLLWLRLALDLTGDVYFHVYDTQREVVI